MKIVILLAFAGLLVAAYLGTLLVGERALVTNHLNNGTITGVVFDHLVQDGCHVAIYEIDGGVWIWREYRTIHDGGSIPETDLRPQLSCLRVSGYDVVNLYSDRGKRVYVGRVFLPFVAKD